MSDVHRLEDDAQRYVAEVLATHGPQDLDALVDNYVPPKPNDMADIKAGLRDGSAAVSNFDAKSWLIEEAIAEVNRVNDNYEVGDEWIEEVISLDKYDPANHQYGQYRLADGVDADKLVDRHREPLIPKSPLPDLYDPETGAWRTNSRTVDLAKRAKLRESMEKLGWQPHLPGIKDEFGVTIVGHAREALAEALGIEPVFKVVTFGVGPAATAAKVALDIASNTGGENISPADRKKIAKDLYGDGTTFSMDEIGKMLKVATSTVSRDLRGFADAKPPAEHGGRPRKGDKESEPQPEPTPKLTVVPEPEPEPVGLDQPEPEDIDVESDMKEMTTTAQRTHRADGQRPHRADARQDRLRTRRDCGLRHEARRRRQGQAVRRAPRFPQGHQ